MSPDTHSESRIWTLSLAQEGAIILVMMLAAVVLALTEVIRPSVVPHGSILVPALLIASILGFVQWAAKGGMPPMR